MQYDTYNSVLCIWYSLPDACCMILWYFQSDTCIMILNIQYLLSENCYPILAILYLLHDTCYMINVILTIWYLLSDSWCFLSGHSITNWNFLYFTSIWYIMVQYGWLQSMIGFEWPYCSCVYHMVYISQISCYNMYIRTSYPPCLLWSEASCLAACPHLSLNICNLPFKSEFYVVKKESRSSPLT